jgi:hypothetical protein
VRFQISSLTDVGYVFSTGDQFEQLCVNLVVEGRRRLNGTGSLLVKAEIDTGPALFRRADSYIRISVRGARALDVDAAPVELFHFGSEPSESGMAVVRSIALASQGFTRVSEPAQGVKIVEVFLPRHGSQAGRLIYTSERAQTVLLIGFAPHFADSFRRRLGEDILLLEAASLPEAEVIVRLYQGSIQAAVLNEGHLLAEAASLVCNKMSLYRPDLKILRIPRPEPALGNEPLNTDDLIRQVKNLLRRVSIAHA